MILKINDKVVDIVTEANVGVGSLLYNGVQFYTLMINLKFTIGDEKGYISLDAMRFKENDIEAFKDRSYTNIEYTDSLIEIYDTSSFYDDFPEESLRVVTKDIKDNKLNLDLKINTDFLNVSIEGYIDIKNKKYIKAID